MAYWCGSAEHHRFPSWENKTMTNLLPADVKTSSSKKCSNRNTSSRNTNKNGALQKCHRPNKLGNIKINCWCLPYFVSNNLKDY